MLRHFMSPVVTKAVAASVVGCAMLVMSARAQAQDAAPAGALGQGFGTPGQFVISTETAGGPPFAGFSGIHFDKANHGGWLFEIRPAADYFVIPNVTVGAVVGFAIDNAKNKGVEVGGRAGFNFNLNDHIGAWGRVGINYNHVSTTGPSSSFTFLPVSAMIMYHPAPHFFLGLGPYYNVKLSGEANHNYGLATLIGGWF
ncbi:MAG TPA: hypothetical protein VIF57_19755 [Polyangia bacterium]|jgi:opacity protein-like surface antigen